MCVSSTAVVVIPSQVTTSWSNVVVCLWSTAHVVICMSVVCSVKLMINIDRRPSCVYAGESSSLAIIFSDEVL